MEKVINDQRGRAASSPPAPATLGGFKLEPIFPAVPSYETASPSKKPWGQPDWVGVYQRRVLKAYEKAETLRTLLHKPVELCLSGKGYVVK